MSAAPSHSLSADFHSRDNSCAPSRKSLSEKPRLHLTEHEALSRLVIRALWASFPEEHSEDGVSIAAAPYFRGKDGEPISPRTVKYWLRGETLPSALHLQALFVMNPRLFLSHWLGASE